MSNIQNRSPTDIQLIDVDPVKFWSGRVIPTMVKTLAIILFSCWIFSTARDNLEFMEVFRYLIFIIAIPIYHLFALQKDSIHFFSFNTKNNLITVKWSKQDEVMEREVSKDNLKAKIRENPFLRNSVYLHLELYNDVVIKQYSNHLWDKQLMAKAEQILAPSQLCASRGTKLLE